MPKLKKSFDWVWKYAFLASLPLGALVLRENLTRATDGDDGFLIYDGGMRSWSEVLSSLVIPPADKPFLFGRHRPFIELLFKSVWSLGLSPVGVNILFWVSFWISCLALGWGMKRVLELGVPMAPGSKWAIATLLFWSPPGMIVLPTPIATSFIATWVGLSFGLLAGMRPGRDSWIKGSLAVVCAFLAFQLHESPWFFLIWLAAWLFGIRYLAKNKNVFPKFWWPLALIGVYFLIFRSFSPNQNNRSDLHLGFDAATLWRNGSYFVLATLNGLSRPLFALTGEHRQNLDVELSSYPVAFVLTVAAIVLALRERTAPKDKGRLWLWISIVSWGFILFSGAPYWIIVSHRFLYFALLPATFLVIWLVAQVSRGGRVSTLPVALLLAANVLTSCQTVFGFNWLKWNDQYVKYFYSQVMSRQEFRSCTTDQPCCVQIAGREWGRNEWMLNWLSGGAKQPTFIPDNLPGAHCVRTLTIN